MSALRPSTPGAEFTAALRRAQGRHRAPGGPLAGLCLIAANAAGISLAIGVACQQLTGTAQATTIPTASGPVPATVPDQPVEEQPQHEAQMGRQGADATTTATDLARASYGAHGRSCRCGTRLTSPSWETLADLPPLVCLTSQDRGGEECEQ